MNARLSASELKPHKLTVDDLYAFEMGGAFDGLPRMELLDGTLYEMSPQTSRHVVTKNELGFRLRNAVLQEKLPLYVLIEPTITTAVTSAPEPDIAVFTQLRVERYYPANLVRLAVEVAITTVDTDLNYKKALYAEAGIPEYWVVEVDAARVHQFSLPEDGSYRDTRVFEFGLPIVSATIAGLEVATDDLI